MLTRKQFTGAIVAMTIATLPVMAQQPRPKRQMDPEVLNYKLSMDRIRAYDVMMRKLYASAKVDPALRTEMEVKPPPGETLDDIVRRIEKNPHAMAIMKAGGFTAREFVVLPMAMMGAGAAFMMQTQSHQPAPNVSSAENVAFFEKNRAELEKITQGWMQEQQK